METQQEYITDALEMIGAKYPTLEIEQERTVISRKNGRLTEETHPAFVKISTGFKAEMGDMQPADLKVWLYIALSVNRNTGTAWPGLRKISQDCQLAINTVRDSIERLEEKNLLTVERKEGASSIYTPSDYVSANKTGVSNFDTVAKTVSKKRRTVSKSAKTVSVKRQKNAQPEEPESTRHTKYIQRPNFANMSIPETLSIPEIQAFRQATGWTPGSFVCDAVYDFMKAGIGVDNLSAAFKEWNLRGYNPRNVAGYLEWAKSGIPTQKGTQPNGYKRNASPNSGNIETEISAEDLADARAVLARKQASYAGL